MANAAMMMMPNVEHTIEKDLDAMFNLNVKGADRIGEYGLIRVERLGED